MFVHRFKTKSRVFILLILIAIFNLWPVPALAEKPASHVDWIGAVPPVAKDSGLWKDLVDEFLKKQMLYGAMVASHRMLSLFGEQEVKEKAYQVMVQLIDLGYPFSTLNSFVTGDLDIPSTTDFASSYYLYKALASLDQGMNKWAEDYFTLVNKEKSERYFFYKAIDAYKKNDFPGAEKFLKKILDEKATPTNFSLIKKAGRTLARIYFERMNYARSLDIYQSFLLRLNPVEPNDWLEGAWDLYNLKEYDSALGMLSNLESKAGGNMINLEKYELRALIYQGLCQNKYTERLYTSFENEFGSAILGVKMGINLTKIPKLNHIYFAGNEPYYELLANLKNLREEQKSISSLSGSYRDLAKYLYRTEIIILEKKLPVYAEDASQKTADHLISYSEKLRFIKFDTAKSGFSADSAAEIPKVVGSPVAEKEKEPQIHWIQKGDYWRDERSHYRAVVENRCLN